MYTRWFSQHSVTSNVSYLFNDSCFSYTFKEQQIKTAVSLLQKIPFLKQTIEKVKASHSTEGLVEFENTHDTPNTCCPLRGISEPSIQRVRPPTCCRSHSPHPSWAASWGARHGRHVRPYKETQLSDALKHTRPPAPPPPFLSYSFIIIPSVPFKVACVTEPRIRCICEKENFMKSPSCRDFLREGVLSQPWTQWSL